MSEKLNLEEVKQKTMELLGTTNPEDVSYITQKYLDLSYDDDVHDENDLSNKEWDDDAKMFRTVYYVHNTSFDGNYYRYHRGDGSSSQACSHANYKKVPFSSWDHQNTNRNCSHGGGAHSSIAKIISR
jgi:hypothetical protein